MAIVSIAILLLIGTVWACACLGSIYLGIKSLRGWRGPIRIVAGILALLGSAGFFGAALSSLGGLDWLGSFQWPMGYTTEAVRAPDGNYIIPHSPAERVQVYDSKLNFIRGWRIDAGGGTFTVRVTPDGKIDIYTSRKQWHLVYSETGELLNQAKYSDDEGGSRLNPPSEALSLWIPTRFWLWPLTGPFYAWICMVLGVVSWVLLDRKPRVGSRGVEPKDETHVS